MRIKVFIGLFLLSGILLFSGCFGERLSSSELVSRAASSALNGNWKDSRNYAARAAKLEKNNANIRVLYALALENTGDVEGALNEIGKAIALNEKSYIAQFTKGRILYRQGRYDSCVLPLKAALALRPNSTDAMILLAQTSVSNRDATEARRYYGMLAKSPIYRSHAAPWSELGMSLLLDSRDAANALKYLNYAHHLAPNNPTAILNMAVLYDVYLKRPKDAKAFYQRYLNSSKMDSSLETKREAVKARLKALQ